MRTLLHRTVHWAVAAALALAGTPAPAAAQAGTTFDLAGPALTMSVTRGDATLPIAQVPALATGDRLTLKADLPADQSARFLLVLAFLRGATNPPPKNWFFKAETWKPKKATLSVAIPKGAEQVIAFLAPETGGGYDAIVDAVRGRPGVFVRAAQDLHQASLDRARLEAFVAGVAKVEDNAPEGLAQISPRLASTLAIRLDAECLQRPRALQAACLTQNREGMVLQTGRGTTLAEALSGTPTEIAYSLAATREGGGGFYSPYIALARDVAKLFGAFRSADYQYAPALAVGAGERLRLQLNAAPSFQNPKSVLVAPLPPIGGGAQPALRAASKEPVCLSRPGVVLALEDAPLVFATDYARALSLRLRMADGRNVSLPVAADAARGGLVVTANKADVGSGAIAEAVLEGRWGFDALAGPQFVLQNGAPAAWTPRPDAAVVVGRETPLTLEGGAASCVEQVSLRDPAGALKKVEWKASGADEIVATLPLARTRPGDLTLLVSEYGTAPPAALTLKGQTEASRIEGFTLYTGDTQGVLTGGRLDQVAELEVAGLTFAPGTLARGDAGGDRLTLTTTGATNALATGVSTARVRLRDGRTSTVRATVSPPRPRIELVSRSIEAAPQTGHLALTLPDDALSPDARLTFSARIVNARLLPGDAIEVATGDGSVATKLTAASGALQLVGGDIAVASFRPREALGPAATGALRMRLVQGDAAGEWQPLAHVVRLPELDALACPGTGGACTLSGSGLFLIAAVAGEATFAKPETVPAGFVGAKLEVPRPATAGVVYLKLHDAPDAVVRATVAKRK